MGWVVSKPNKETFCGDLDGNIDPVNITFSSNISRDVSNHKCSTQRSIEEVFHEAELPSHSCDILIIDHDMEYCDSSDLIKSSMTNEESLYSLPLEISDHIELINDISEFKLNSIVKKLSTNDIQTCQDVKSELSTIFQIHQPSEKKTPMRFKNKTLKHISYSNKGIDKCGLSKKPKLKSGSNTVKGDSETDNSLTISSGRRKQSEVSSLPLKTPKPTFITKKMNVKSTNQKLPSIANNANKTPNKSTVAKINNKKPENHLSNCKSLRINKLKIPLLDSSEIKKIKDDFLSILNERNASPDMVDEIEKRLQGDECFLEQPEKTMDCSNTSADFKCKDRQRPTSAYMISANKTENFDNIIQDFNNKLERMIKENHAMNSCNNCNKRDGLVENKTTAGKITFFFLKRYGNVGKFILARLNEFLDNVYKINPDRNEEGITKNLHDNNFPLPCNVNDIEYEGDLKSYNDLTKAGLISKPSPPKSRLPKLVANKMTKMTGNLTNESEKSSNTYAKPKSKDSNEFKSSKKKLKFKDKDKEIKTDQMIGKSFDLEMCLPPLKPASSIMNFYKTTNIEKNNNMVFRTMDLSSDRNPLPRFDYNEILNILYDDKTMYNDNYSKSSARDSNRTENDMCTNGFESSLRSDEQNEDDISVMANKLIDDLWKSTFISGCLSKSIVSD